MKELIAATVLGVGGALVAAGLVLDRGSVVAVGAVVRFYGELAGAAPAVTVGIAVLTAVVMVSELRDGAG